MKVMNSLPWMRSVFLAVAGFLVLAARAPCQQNNLVPLWPLAAPMAKGGTPQDMPGILLDLPSTSHPTPGVVICPSGSYAVLALEHDGQQVAEWLNNLGIAAFVLKYRLAPAYHYPVQLLDAQRALRYIRANASIYNVVPNQIGIMGFSAGGQLAALAATNFDSSLAPPSDSMDRVSARPNFLVLISPVITCSEPFRYALACENLLGPHPRPGLAAQVSVEKHVTSKTPPTFILHFYDDSVVPVENSTAFFAALRKAGVPTEFHIFEHGPHVIGVTPDDPILATWPKLLENWFRTRGLLPRQTTP